MYPLDHNRSTATLFTVIAHSTNKAFSFPQTKKIGKPFRSWQVHSDSESVEVAEGFCFVHQNLLVVCNNDIIFIQEVM